MTRATRYRTIRALPLLLLLLLGCERGTDTQASPAPSAETPRAVSAPPRAFATPKKQRAPAGPSELALVAPLAPGSDLGGFSVRAIYAVTDGLLVVECENANGRTKIALTIALRDDAGPAPPASAGRYAVFYSLRNAEVEDGEKLALALAAILDKHADVPVPPGLRTFVPTPVPI